MKHVLCAVLGLPALGLSTALLAANTAQVDTQQTLIPAEDISTARLAEIFQAAFISAKVDQDGDLEVRENDITLYAKVDPDKQLISWFALWKLKEDESELKKLQMANRMNDKLIFARFSVPDATTLWCDHHQLFAGGVSAYALVQNYRLTSKVCRGAVASMDDDDLVASQ